MKKIERNLEILSADDIARIHAATLEILDEVGIVLNSGFEQGDEHVVTAWIVARIGKHLLHRFVERTEVLITPFHWNL